MPLHTIRFPGESEAYSAARNELLEAEIRLRKSIEEVAAMRRMLPPLNVFVRRDGKIYHFYNTELLFAPKEPGQDARHVDSIWPLWSLFDFTPDGRGTNWYPKLTYGQGNE